MTETSTDDIVLSFFLGRSGVRGRLVRLGPALHSILTKHGYPVPVAKLLAESVALGAALGSLLKYQGRFTLQTKGDGPLGLMVADLGDDGRIRGYAQFDAAGITRMGDEGIGLMGKGHMALTVLPPAGSPDHSYQGIVALRGKTLAEAAQNYFRQSEQIPTGLIAAVGGDDITGWRTTAVLVQRVAGEGGAQGAKDIATAAEDWRRVMILLASATPAEMTDPTLMGETLLHRLFHEEDLQHQSSRRLYHGCSCHERLTTTLALFDDAAWADMADHGIVTLTCQFCNAQHRFDATSRAPLAEA